MRWLVILTAICLVGCQQGPEPTLFAPADYPKELSSWGILSIDEGRLVPAPASAIYDLNTPLFSDYAHKLRTIYVPQGKRAEYREFEAFDMPIGTIISKTFFYLLDDTGAIDLHARWNGDPASLEPENVRLVETRLLVRQAQGWDALPYIWQGDRAQLRISGDLLRLQVNDGETVPYLVPSRNQCSTCHATDHTAGDIRPIGIKARHLNRPDPVRHESQLADWHARGWLENLPDTQSIATNARLDDLNAPLSHRARSYLDINCGHCHNPQGSADTSGLLLDYQPHPMAAMGECKPPIASGRGSGGYLYGIVPGNADESIMTFRMRTRDPATMMPELGRTLVHAEGVQLVSRWIDSLPGECL